MQKLRTNSVFVLCLIAFASACSAKAVETENTTPTGTPCADSKDCRGGEYCDRGSCALTQTGDFGHGYGAQCLGEEFYPEQNGVNQQWIHCGYYPCVDGHCSSCEADAECPDGMSCVTYPGRPGRTCSRPDEVPSEPVECGVAPQYVPCPKPEAYPEPTLVGERDDECTVDLQCQGDEFCDRGACASIWVDEAGHGYGAQCRRTEPPSTGNTCLGYLCLDHRCQSCLDDSECFEEAPYCLEVYPFSLAGRVCSAFPTAHYYDEDGKLREEFAAERAEYVEKMQSLSEGRVEVGLVPYPELD